VAGGGAFHFFRFNNRNNGPTPPLFLVNFPNFFAVFCAKGAANGWE
jgi:hypothetical protein